MKSEQVQDPLGRVVIALDTPDRATFDRWCEQFGPRVGMLKVGLEAFVRWGHDAVGVARRHARGVFLDLKLHDIPNTVRGAVTAARASGVDLLTVHASGGASMLAAASRAAGDETGILAVTVLTHLDEAELEALDLPGSSQARAESWVRLAREAGCAGAVCSPLEVATLRRSCAPPFLLVTPGIRLAAAERDDQQRIASPGQALRAGADLLVVGRPVTGAPDPEAALQEIAREMEEALAPG
jgi:orotidine-5'-phosphate decarboxylase